MNSELRKFIDAAQVLLREIALKEVNGVSLTVAEKEYKVAALELLVLGKYNELQQK